MSPELDLPAGMSSREFLNTLREKDVTIAKTIRQWLDWWESKEDKQKFIQEMSTIPYVYKPDGTVDDSQTWAALKPRRHSLEALFFPEMIATALLKLSEQPPSDLGFHSPERYSLLAERTQEILLESFSQWSGQHDPAEVVTKHSFYQEALKGLSTIIEYFNEQARLLNDNRPEVHKIALLELWGTFRNGAIDGNGVLWGFLALIPNLLPDEKPEDWYQVSQDSYRFITYLSAFHEGVVARLLMYAKLKSNTMTVTNSFMIKVEGGKRQLALKPELVADLMTMSKVAKPGTEAGYDYSGADYAAKTGTPTIGCPFPQAPQSGRVVAYLPDEAKAGDKGAPVALWDAYARLAYSIK